MQKYGFFLMAQAKYNKVRFFALPLSPALVCVIPDWLAKAATTTPTLGGAFHPQPLADRQPSESIALPVPNDKISAGKRAPIYSRNKTKIA